MTAAALRRRAVRRLRVGRAGYTIVEIMIALGVLAIGGSAIIAMQRVSVMGTISAQNLVNASTIASGYASRVEAEGASTWTVNNTTGLAGTIFNRGMTTQDTWIEADPNGTGTDESMVDLRGRPATGTDVAYCSFVRVSKLADDTVRVDVRTLYSKQGNTVSDECALGAATINDMIDNNSTITIGSVAHARDEYGIAFVSTATRRVQL